MTDDGHAALPARALRPAWREPGAWLLVLLVAVLHFATLGEPPVRGEEPRRGRIAYEMVRSGDYVVPRQQGELHLSRPPLHNWCIAACGALRGRTDALSIRFTSALALLATALLLYGYGRRIAGEAAGFVAGAAYVSMLQVMEIGWRGETESLFALFVAGSLFVWHLGARRGPLTWRTWVAAYALVGLGTLTKGPQAPVYFGLAVAAWLFVRRRWRELLRPAHFAGLAVWAAILGAWLVPFWRRTDLEAVRQIFAGDVGLRFEDTRPLTVVENLALYPLEVLGSLLPWSLLLLPFASRRFRRGLPAASRDAALFGGLAIALSFPSVWLPPGSKPRYYMPLYPVFAALVGLVAAQAWSADAGQARRVWARFLALCALLMAGLGPALAAVRLFVPADSAAVAPWSFTLGAGALGLVLAAVTWRGRAATAPLLLRRATLAVAGLMGLAFVGYVKGLWVRESIDTPAQIAALRERLPAGVELVSLGVLDPVFAHYWGDYIDWRDVPRPALEAPEDVEYFCFSPRFTYYTMDDLRFDWEPIATVICDFRRRDEPRRPVVVGRVRRPAEAGQ